MGWPIPRIAEMIDRIGSNTPNVFAKMDMPSGYHQAPLDERSVSATAFITSQGKYEFLRVPMGLKSATAYFQEMMTKILGNAVGKEIEVYLDVVCARR